MERGDLRGNIIPTDLENTDNRQRTGNIYFNTTDLIYLDSLNERYKNIKNKASVRISPTDYAQMNYALVHNYVYTLTGNLSTWTWLRNSSSNATTAYITSTGKSSSTYVNCKDGGICPSLHYKLPSRKDEKVDIKEVKDTDGNVLYYTVQIGEYPKTKVDEELSNTLEQLYNKGNIQDNLKCTGRWFSGNGQRIRNKDYIGIHCPEFEYNGERYVRVVSYPNYEEDIYSDGTPSGWKGTIRWAKVEPIPFVIKNWGEMPKWINPNGNGKAHYFSLRSENAITANFPFYPNQIDTYRYMWQNSSIRGFLNGIDVENIVTNGILEYGAGHGGNFEGECNFLNEAFNLSREPMIEYRIPDSETEIADNAFNGCISLKKLIIHPGIKSIGKNAFDGLNFRYAYKNYKNEIIFSNKLPEDKEKYVELIEIPKIMNALKGFDYGMLLKNKDFNSLKELVEVLEKNKFSIPYEYGIALALDGKEKIFNENTDFRFFKNEIPNINNELANYSDSENINFYKFAYSLGCFSKEKILDKRYQETSVPLAQKASSFLAILLRTDSMRLR